MLDRKLKQTKNNTKATIKMVVTFVVVALLGSTSMLNRMVHLQKENLLQEHRFSLILHCCLISTLAAQGVFLVHFSHITQSIASSFKNVTFKMERVVIRNHFRSLTPYHILSSDSDRGGYTSTEGIKDVIRDYWLLCDTVREVNAFYSDQLMAVVLSTLLRATIQISTFVIMYIQDGVTFDTIHAGMWSLAHVIFLLLLAYLSTNVTESADEMARSVLGLINMEIDEELRDELEGFLFQLYNNKVELSALGFFKINFQTLTMMAGAITTYMVILVQFHTSS